MSVSGGENVTETASAENCAVENTSNSGSKVFCGGLCEITTAASLRKHFEDYGKVLDAVVLTDKTTGRSRGFGFVTFDSDEIVDSILSKPHVIDNREVDCKKAVPRTQDESGNQGSSGSQPTADHSFVTKIFVGGLPQSCTEDKLKEYFGKYGVVRSCSMMVDRDTQRHRGFGFVEFESSEIVDEVVRHYYDHHIDNKWVECKRAVPRDTINSGQNANRQMRNHAAQNPALAQGAMSLSYHDYYRGSYPPGQTGNPIYDRYSRTDPRYLYGSYPYPPTVSNQGYMQQYSAAAAATAASTVSQPNLDVAQPVTLQTNSDLIGNFDYRDSYGYTAGQTGVPNARIPQSMMQRPPAAPRRNYGPIRVSSYSSNKYGVNSSGPYNVDVNSASKNKTPSNYPY